MNRTAKPAGLLTAFLAGCSFQDTGHWTDQLEPDGPCWAVNLVDGIDEGSTEELHNLFACVNQSGNFDGLAPVNDALDASTRFGTPLGTATARLVNAMGSNGVQMLQWAGAALELIIEFEGQADLAQDAIVEVVYGRPVSQVNPAVDRIADGIAVPLLSTIGTASSLLLDGGSAVQQELIAAANSDTATQLTCTLVSTTDASSPIVQSLPDTLLSHMSRAWLRASDTGNNTTHSASGNSIRDLVDWADLGGTENRIGPIRGDLATLLADDAVRIGLRNALATAEADGHLIDLPTQFLHLANVDPSGRPLSSAGADPISALEAGVRLMDSANREMECTVPVLGLSVELGNLSVEILERIASAEPGEFVARLDLLQGIWGLGLTQLIAESLAVSGACDGFNPQVLNDMRVIERLSDPPVADLAIVLHGFIDAVYEPGGHNRLAEAVNVLAFLHNSEAMPIVQEVLRDLSDTELTGIAVAMIPPLIDEPAECANGTTAIGFDDLWEQALDSITEDDPTRFNADVLGPLLGVESMWESIDRFAQLGVQTDAATHGILRAVTDWLADSDEPLTAAAMVRFLEHPTVYVDALAIAENQELNDALAATDTDENPLTFIAHLILSDTVTVMLQTLHLVLDSLGVNQQQPD